MMSNVGGIDFLISIWETRCNRHVYRYVLLTDGDYGDGHADLRKIMTQNFTVFLMSTLM